MSLKKFLKYSFTLSLEFFRNFLYGNPPTSRYPYTAGLKSTPVKSISNFMICLSFVGFASSLKQLYLQNRHPANGVSVNRYDCNILAMQWASISSNSSFFCSFTFGPPLIQRCYDESKIKTILLNASGETSLESAILGTFELSSKLNQELLFKVLSKVLCK